MITAYYFQHAALSVMNVVPPDAQMVSVTPNTTRLLIKHANMSGFIVNHCL